MQSLFQVLSTTNLLVLPRATAKSSADINENNNGEVGILSEECGAELGLTDQEVKERGKPLEDVIAQVSHHIHSCGRQFVLPFIL